jgi:hypothetical protein
VRSRLGLSMKSILLAIATVALSVQLGMSQTSVTILTSGQFVSYLQNGTPNAFGCVFTYASGTTTPLQTFTDYTGTTANPNPVPLTAGGTANIWLVEGSIYTIVVKTSGGINCASGSTIYSASGINQGLLNTANIWNGTQTFLQQIFLTQADSQIVFGSTGALTTLDVPPTSGDYILHGPPITGNDVLVSQNATQGLANKTLVSPIIGQAVMTSTPGAYIALTNNTGTGTIVYSLTKLTSAPSTGTPAATSDTGGIVGICVSGCGNSGQATIQQSGGGICNFDGATTAGDYVQISSTVGGSCHDVGASYPGSGQVIGRVESTNGTSGVWPLTLFGPEIQPRGAICASGTPTTVGSATTSVQVISTCAFPAGALNVIGKTFRVTAGIYWESAGSYTGSIGFGMGTTSALGGNQIVTSNSATSGSLYTHAQMVCSVTTTGTSGALTCTDLPQATTPSAPNLFNPGLPSFTSLNLTGVVYVGSYCQFGTSNASNTCTGNPFVVEQLN